MWRAPVPIPPPAPAAMHAPDGFFAPWLALLGWLLTALLIRAALRHTRQQLDERQIPLLAILAAAVFAGQMLNFSIPGGTSGHLLGGTLIAILMGPWAAVLAMTAVIGIQGLVFQDGGLLAMGLNILNMGVITAFVGYFIHRTLRRWFRGKAGYLGSAFVAAWVAMVVSASAAALELALSGSSPLQFALPAMAGVHAVIGLGEGLLTAAALGFVWSARPDLVDAQTTPGQRSAAWVAAGLVLALAITLLAPLASPYADGLERIAEVFAAPEGVDIQPIFSVPGSPQFFAQAQEAPYEILPDYAIPGLRNENISTILAGMLGALVVFGLTLGASRLTQSRTRR